MAAPRWPAVLDYGFRPFFLLAALYGMWAGLAVARDPGLGPWHGHAMLFGFAPAILAGFLLTAIPNWTGTLPLRNGPLLALVLVWLAGRGPVPVAWQGLLDALDLAFLPLVALAACVPVIRTRRWRSFKVLAGLLLLALAHPAAHAGLPVAPRLGLAAYAGMIAVVGGRLLDHLCIGANGPAPPRHSRADALCLGMIALALATFALVPPGQTPSGLSALCAAGVLAVAIRQGRWRPHVRAPEALALYVAHACLGLGLLAAALPGPPALADHLIGLGAMGLAMLAVMVRTVRRFLPPGADRAIDSGTIFGLVGAALLMRTLADFVADIRLLALAGLFWLLALGLFVLRFGPALLGIRRRA